MLWYKSWLDTRWRFLLGLVLLLVLAGGTVVSFSMVQELAASAPIDTTVRNNVLQQGFAESLAMARTFRGYTWSTWFSQNFPSLLTIFAALLGSGSPLAKSGGGALFSLALPVSRGWWIGTRVVMGLAELLMLALVPSIAIAALAPLVGEQYPLADAIVYGLCAFAVASLFFGFAMFLSTVFNDIWRPLLLTCLAAIGAAVFGLLLPEERGLFAAMGGGGFFYGGSVSWVELLVSVAAAAGLVYAAAATVARRDF